MQRFTNHAYHFGSSVGKSISPRQISLWPARNFEESRFLRRRRGETQRRCRASRHQSTLLLLYFLCSSRLYYTIYHSTRSRTETLPSRLVRVLVHTQLQPHTSLSTPRTTGTANTQKHQNTRWLDRRLDIFYRHITTSHHAPFFRPSLRRLSCTTPSGTATHPLDPTRPRPVTFPTINFTGRAARRPSTSCLS